MGRRLEVVAGTVAAMVSSVAPAPPGWVFLGPWPLHPSDTTSTLCLSILELEFIPTLLTSGWSHHSV